VWGGGAFIYCDAHKFAPPLDTINVKTIKRWLKIGDFKGGTVLNIMKKKKLVEATYLPRLIGEW
jgi:hypothetical protein